jgi:transcription-repair coupling factor (superfamily II helicase)
LTGARPALLAALQSDLYRPILFITARADRARIFAEQIQVWAEDPTTVHRLPDPDALPYEKVAWGPETIQGRLAALAALVIHTQQETPALPPLIVTSARALMHYTLPPGEFTTMKFKVGQRLKLNEVVGEWVALGYQPEDVVEVPGSFSRRGGILDIFPANSALPIRIELFGDEIDSLRTFDPTTQRSENRLSQFIVSPASEALPRHAEQAAAELSQWDLTDLQPSAKLSFEEDLAQLASGTAFRGIEYYLPFFYNGTSPPPDLEHGTSILDYLPPEALIFIEDPEELAAVVDELESQARSLKKDLTDVGDLPEAWGDPYFTWQTLAAALAARNALSLGFTAFKTRPTSSPKESRKNLAVTSPPSQTEPPAPTYLLQTTFMAAPTFGGQIKNVITEIVERKKRGERISALHRSIKIIIPAVTEPVFTFHWAGFPLQIQS